MQLTETLLLCIALLMFAGCTPKQKSVEPKIVPLKVKESSEPFIDESITFDNSKGSKSKNREPAAETKGKKKKKKYNPKKKITKPKKLDTENIEKI